MTFLTCFKKKYNINKLFKIIDNIQIRKHKQKLLDNLKKTKALTNLKNLLVKFSKRNLGKFENDLKEFISKRNVARIFKILQSKDNNNDNNIINKQKIWFLELHMEYFEILNSKCGEIRVLKTKMNKKEKNDLYRTNNYITKNKIVSNNLYDEFNYKGFSKDK